MINLRLQLTQRGVELNRLDKLLDSFDVPILTRTEFNAVREMMPALTNDDISRYFILRCKIQGLIKYHRGVDLQSPDPAIDAPWEPDTPQIVRNLEIVETVPVLRYRPAKIRTEAQENYQDYLKSDHWMTMKRLALDYAEHRCQICYSQRVLNVHHRTYKRLSKEKLTDLTVLCRDCHEIFHKNGKLCKN